VAIEDSSKTNYCFMTKIAPESIIKPKKLQSVRHPADRAAQAPPSVALRFISLFSGGLSIVENMAN